MRRETVLGQLRDQLVSGVWHPQGYRTFKICDPKERTISAAPYTDRIVHHAVCNVIAPILERSLIHHTYSCRIGKGTGAARMRCRRLARTCRYALKLDVRQYFASIDHLVLKSKLRRLIKCAKTLEVLDAIIDSWHALEQPCAWFEGDSLFTPLERKRGLPIGSLTSQLFANLYLSRIDHLIEEDVRPVGYVRYTDDLMLFSDSKKFLHSQMERLREELTQERLQLHTGKSRVIACRIGVPFLGFRFFPDRVRVLRANRRRFENRMQSFRRRLRQDRRVFRDVWPSMFGWFQFVREQPGGDGLILAQCRNQVF